MEKYRKYIDDSTYEFIPYSNKKFANGGNVDPSMANAQVEKEENTLNPDGSSTQFDLPSHEQQSSEEGTYLAPGTLIFSDRLKMPGTGKTFAKLNKPNSTKREDKILEDNTASTVSKDTASMMKHVKTLKSQMLFEVQEELKQTKLDNYTKRLGGIQKYPDGGITVPRKPNTGVTYNQGLQPDTNSAGLDSSGFPIDKFGRRLSNPEMLGFNRSSVQGNTYTNTGGGVSSPGVGTMGLGNVGGVNTVQPYQGSVGTIPQFTYVNDPSKGSYDQQWQAHLNTVNLGTMSGTPPIVKKAYGGRMYPNGGKFAPVAKEIGLGLLQNAGNIYDLSRSQEAVNEQYGRMTPALLDPTASLRDADIASNSAAYDLADRSSGNAGNYLANRIQLAGATTLNKDRIRRDYANQNAGIKNAAQQYNLETGKQETIANLQNQAQTRNIKGAALSNTGVNVMSQYRDKQLADADLEKIGLIKQMYPAIKNNPELVDYLSKKYKIKFGD